MRAVSGSRRESVLREAFKDLLKRWGRSHDLQFVSEHDIVTPQKNRIYLDGALLHALRVPFGYWEAKDADDDLDAEIAAKTRKGYPRDNIIYSDDHTAVLIQDGHEVARALMDDTDALYPLLVRFYAHERREIADFNKAVKQFAADLPEVLKALRNLIAEKRAASSAFAAAERAFLKHAQDAINPAVREDDVQEMLIQHILTEDIFAKVFDNPDFHRQNNVASELYKLEEKLFARGEKSTLLRALSPYYSGIAQTAAVIQSHSEKQGFLKGLYENFYKVYNAKAADRLGVVYTPGEIVRFMIRSADWLCERHFGKNLIDRGVEILDPATGTGTFIVELLEHFRGHHDKLRHKYKEELHANEIAILPYYVANLNIEATYQAITGQFAEFENLCFVDTLDNVDALGIHSGHQFDMLGTLTDENIERIKRQNRRKISVIIGNPPYNANQQNENDNNKNRTYAHIDKRIKDTYIKASTAQKTKLYDMYARFYRWASDRLGDEGLVAFVTNSSFLEARTFDGFRKRVAQDFSEAWVIDLKGNARNSGERRRREGGNVFQDKIKVGVAIAFFVRRRDKQPFKLHYLAVDDYVREDDKREFVARRNLATDRFTVIKPNEAGDWLNQLEVGEWSNFIATADKNTKQGKSATTERAIFKLYSLGVKTNRDDWAVSFSRDALNQLYRFMIDHYLAFLKTLPGGQKRDWKQIEFDQTIKWTRKLRRLATAKTPLQVRPDAIAPSLYRPFTRLPMTFVAELNEDQYQLDHIIRRGEPNPTMMLSGYPSAKPAQALATNIVWHHDTLDKTNGLPRYRYTKTGERIDNITDWALNKFVAHYGKKGVTKGAIFHYVYAVLHDPVYRETYALNLKREFPRIPFYPDFARWAAWGETLMAMHIGYEDVAPWPVERIDVASKRAAGTTPKPILKSQSEAGAVVIDADTQITGIPPEAWTYRLGNRSAIDWVLDQHKEKTPRDPTIAAKFNTYRFADYKESMIALLAKVVRVSVETVAITDAMKALDRGRSEAA
ncbi:type ISP restriction/modification enzyme [Sphingomonas bacterium]|uniref:type ISP restriction/modification enzyme n=1 Tax=Sphingomonas bacterium TaxID=1895847 RepID=UPI001C2DBD71|nr:type ISP restriction/modification enzyme [Sphingomonas bacterium]